MAEREEELKRLSMKVKEESGKSWLKTQHSENDNHGIWSHHFMASRWGNNGNSDRLLFWLKTQHSENDNHGIWSHHFMASRWGNNGNSDRLLFS